MLFFCELPIQRKIHLQTGFQHMRITLGPRQQKLLAETSKGQDQLWIEGLLDISSGQFCPASLFWLSQYVFLRYLQPIPEARFEPESPRPLACEAGFLQEVLKYSRHTPKMVFTQSHRKDISSSDLPHGSNC